MKIATWNVNSLNVRLEQLCSWLAVRQPDVVALQETKLEDERFPDGVLAERGYRSVFAGQKAYNGVAILARERPHEVVVGIPGFDCEQRRVLAASVGDLRIVNLYVVNGQRVGSDKYAYKLRWLDAVREYLIGELLRFPQLVVLGDFNIAPDDRDVYDPAAWHEKILCSTPEREALRGILRVGLHDSLRLFVDDAGHHSWWDYRTYAFRRNQGLRIDLVLVSDALRARCRGVDIDAETRGWERPSDHAPVVLDME